MEESTSSSYDDKRLISKAKVMEILSMSHREEKIDLDVLNVLSILHLGISGTFNSRF